MTEGPVINLMITELASCDDEVCSERDCKWTLSEDHGTIIQIITFKSILLVFLQCCFEKIVTKIKKMSRTFDSVKSMSVQ